MQVTLVAHYGDKPAALSTLVQHLQGKMHELLGPAFRAYELEQVHGTVIGLEGCRVGTRVMNQHSRSPLNLRGALEFLHGSRFRPISVQIGGYHASGAYPFQSRNTHPYLRSFSIQGDVAVAMGWPNEGGRYPNSLDQLRRAFQEYGIGHKWHRTGNDVDNDFFFVVGTIDRGMTDATALESTTQIVRAELASCGETLIEIDRNTLQLVGYSNPQLPRGASCWFGLDELDLVARLEVLYPECQHGADLQHREFGS
jgi:hypothetical protein